MFKTKKAITDLIPISFNNFVRIHQFLGTQRSATQLISVSKLFGKIISCMWTPIRFAMTARIG
jgi:hypothetical protein